MNHPNLSLCLYASHHSRARKRGEIMGKSNYNIAVIIAGIDEEYQNEILTGIEEFTSENRVNIAVFVSFSGVMGNQRHDVGEFNIFNLPDFSLFDGAILLTNTIGYQPIIDKILTRIKKAGIPAVSVDYDIDGFYHIGIDNERAMRDITEHIIHKHGCKSFNYVSGPKDNPESRERLESFLKVLDENNIAIDSDRIYYGDFRSPSGRDAVNAFVDSGKPMPKAIVCANDDMAISVMIALNSLGYRVPEDILVSGFDNTYRAHNYPTELTSVERPLHRSGLLACRILYNHFNEIPQERSTILDMHPHFTESCGCAEYSETATDVKALKSMNYKKFSKFESTSQYMSLVNRMSSQLVECDSLFEFTRSLKPFISEIKPELFCMCICSDWNIEAETGHGEPVPVTVEGYTKDMLVPLAFRYGRFSSLPPFASKDILPGLFENAPKGRLYYFIPLHFRERALGYIAIMNSRFPLQSSMFQTWCITLSNMLENVRKIISLDLAVQKLNKLYTIDTLTGIYNRNGFVNNAEPQFRQCIENHRPVMLMFIDMDGLKGINDNYGHDEGDNAIRAIAHIIEDSCVNSEVYCRFGGDEFIIFAAGFSSDEAQRLTQKINDNTEMYNNKYKTPYTIAASIGYHIAYPDEGEELFDLVTIADNIMYKAKKKKKLSKYLKS